MGAAGLVVVGASLAGLRAVEAARLTGYTGAVTLIGAETHLPYDRPPLSKEFLDGPGEPEPPYFRTADSLRTDLGVDLRLGAPATELDLDDRTVTVDGSPIRYGALVLATGAGARPLPGTAGMAGVHTLRGLDDVREIRAALVPGARVVIVGAGFIGAEIACAARRRGIEATVVEAGPAPLLRAVGAEFGPVLGRVLRRCGVDLRCGSGVVGIEGPGRVRAVRLSDGTELPADLVVVGIGATPATDWLTSSGLKLDDGVVCDETLSAGVAGVYAAGDVARWFNPVFGQVMRLENWTTAAEQAAVAARNAVDPDRTRPCATVPYFWSDWNRDRVQFVGLPEAEETMIVAGDVDADSFLALYRRGDRVIGALGLNQRRTVIQLRAAIARGAGWRETVVALRGRTS
ncbi:FAD-dependent oxidoreductase [Micromonospora sp. KC606]|uniref:NAD(P)/FAD-dependent oxidoreductase n=1 Tax=Micromonospora sp. KC606 TaxID=2530379 RepID=UPI00104EE64A|nr:FAD-dependent oxidoreductase [Micromonospora sp. KC606]TDC85981.1 FAD-dependent oxidoreductase [Micromonospora sp. KC606]